MPRRPRTTVRRDANRRSSKGEISLLLRAPINAIGRRKTTCVQGAMSRKATCSTRTQTEEEDADEREVDSAKDKAAEVRPTTTPNFGHKTEANEEPSQEGGASTPVRVVKTQPHPNIVESSAITKKSAERRSANRLPQADNSQITPRTRNTRTTTNSS